MEEDRRTHLAAIPPIPAILAGIVSVQGGAALAKGLFPALGPVGTVGLRVGLSAIMLVAAFRPRLRGTTAAQWRAVIPYGVVLGTMNIVFYLSLSRIPLGVAVTVEFVGPLALEASCWRVVAYGSAPKGTSSPLIAHRLSGVMNSTSGCWPSGVVMTR